MIITKSDTNSVISEPLKKLHNFIKSKLIGGVGSSIKGSIQIMDTSIGTRRRFK